MRFLVFWLAAIGPVAAISLAADPLLRSAIRFEDITATAGLIEPLAGIMGHGGAWGDVN